MLWWMGASVSVLSCAVVGPGGTQLHFLFFYCIIMPANCYSSLCYQLVSGLFRAMGSTGWKLEGRKKCKSEDSLPFLSTSGHSRTPPSHLPAHPACPPLSMSTVAQPPGLQLTLPPCSSLQDGSGFLQLLIFLLPCIFLVDLPVLLNSSNQLHRLNYPYWKTWCSGFCFRLASNW